jgi:hypothetical protein
MQTRVKKGRRLGQPEQLLHHDQMAGTAHRKYLGERLDNPE